MTPTKKELSEPQSFGPYFALSAPLVQAMVHSVTTGLLPVEKPAEDPEQEYLSQLEGMGKAVRQAKAAGFKVVEGNPHVLLLDFDGNATLNLPVYEMLCTLLQEVPARCEWTSKSGGKHVLLRFASHKFTPLEAVAYEAALGSDLMRAALYVKRITNGVADPRVLFMPRECSAHTCNSTDDRDG